MGQVHHGSATTTAAVRRAIQYSQESLRQIARRFGINPKTVAKWKKRPSTADQKTGPSEPKSTVLSVEDEAVIVAFRRHTLLPLDDCLYALQTTIPHLFAAADAREGQLIPEVVEQPVALAPMLPAREVVEDYRSRGLSLRSHPVAFLRDDLTRRRVLPCAALARAHNGQRVTVAGLVLVRQKPGSAKGVMFITIEDETEVGNLVIWPSLFEQQRRLILSAGMIACRGRVQREGLVIHVVADHLTNLSDRLRALGQGETGTRDLGDFPLRSAPGGATRRSTAARPTSATAHPSVERPATSTSPTFASDPVSRCRHGSLCKRRSEVRMESISQCT